MESNNEYNIYEPIFFEILVRHVRKGWQVADIGACQGDITIPLAELVGSTGHVYSFDLHPANLASISAKLRATSLCERVTLINAAVSDGNCSEAIVYYGRSNSEYEWNIIGRDVSGMATEAAFKASSLSLDQYFSVNTKLDLVKIDVEGSAALVLKGMYKIVARHKPILLFENHNFEEWNALCDLAYNFNYKIWNPVTHSIIGFDQQPAYHMIAVSND